MRTWWIAIAAVAVASSASGDGKKKKPVHKSTKTTAPAGFYKILVKPNAKWVLRDTIAEDLKRPVSTITVETYDVRKVGEADVARLRWTLVDGADKRDVGDSNTGKFTQVAVTAAGLYIFDASADDAKIAERLKGKPSRSDPPKAYSATKQNEGRYLEVRDNNLVCMGQVDPNQTGPCEDTCFATMCLSATDGVVLLDGNWTPGEPGSYAQKGYDNN